LEEWLGDNEVKTLAECKAWKESVPILDSPVMGIKVYSGSGCTTCRFSQERKREVIAHMSTEHGIVNSEPIDCSVQRVFASNLRAFWRVNTAPYVDQTNDEGLLALQQFSAEFQRLEQADTRSGLGTYLWQVQTNTQLSFLKTIAFVLSG
jgi:hypothetical protein